MRGQMDRHGRRLRADGLFATIIAAICSERAGAQFGGPGGGYDRPAPICPAFTCKAGEKAVGKPNQRIWSYGCEDNNMLNMFNANSFDPNNPFGGMKPKKSVNKCCIDRDICKQTCGMTSKECHDQFQKCTAKICKGDSSCQLNAMMSEMLAEPYDPADSADKYDPEESRCKGFIRGQQESCMCVPKEEVKTANERKLKAFYGKFNPEKLNKDGEIKDVDDVWKKWRGKEPAMFAALATKYKDKAVDIRKRPAPPPYKPPATKSTDEDSGEGDSVASSEEDSVASAEDRDDEDKLFDERIAEVENRKAKAAEEEDFDAAAEAKAEAAKLRREEVRRLSEKKKKAIDEEDFLLAKQIKRRIDKVEL